MTPWHWPSASWHHRHCVLPAVIVIIVMPWPFVSASCWCGLMCCHRCHCDTVASAICIMLLLLLSASHCCCRCCHVSLAIIAIVVMPWYWPLVSHCRHLRHASEDTLSPLGCCRNAVVVSPAICIVSYLSVLCWRGCIDTPLSSSCCHGTGHLCHVVVVTVVAVSHTSRQVIIVIPVSPLASSSDRGHECHSTP